MTKPVVALRFVANDPATFCGLQYKCQIGCFGVLKIHIPFWSSEFIIEKASYVSPKRQFTHYVPFYIRGSVHRNSRLKKSNEVQQYADIYLLLNYSTCFGRTSRQSSGVHKTVVAASGTDHTIRGASFLKRDQIRTDQYLPGHV